MSNIIDRILAEVCLDERIADGIFDMSNNLHMDVLREMLTDTCGVSLNDVKTIHNKMVEGKYPERQAYNRDGLLVTFPTPQHKQRAIQRGTHFEKNPTAGEQNVFKGEQQPSSKQSTQPNVFGGAQQSPTTSIPAPSPTPTPTPTPQPSNLPASDVSSAKSPASVQHVSSNLPTSDVSIPTQSSDTTALNVEPVSSPTSTQISGPPPNFDIPKSPQTKQSEAEVVKNIMRGDDTNPTLSECKRQLVEVFAFSQRMGYKEAMTVILNAMSA